MASILIEGLAFDAVIGVYEWEKKIYQKLRLDLEMAWDISAAAATDDLAHTINYAAVSQRIIECANEQPIELIEAMAEKIADVVSHEFGVSKLRLTLRKPGAVPEADAVGVRIQRGEW
ncbi:dihydroneopterin aldolase [Carnimonas nigrificans]|uniref:dihydroneopterin aldolase n=1 Tax=Carnimonas nigrificans TaxID=64323 RepID=UPI00046E7761|nr:dihydroneopterin aldolase [Carnimonas nigrificans]